MTNINEQINDEVLELTDVVVVGSAKSNVNDAENYSPTDFEAEDLSTQAVLSDVINEFSPSEQEQDEENGPLDLTTLNDLFESYNIEEDDVSKDENISEDDLDLSSLFDDEDNDQELNTKQEDNSLSEIDKLLDEDDEVENINIDDDPDSIFDSMLENSDLEDDFPDDFPDDFDLEDNKKDLDEVSDDVKREVPENNSDGNPLPDNLDDLLEVPAQAKESITDEMAEDLDEILSFDDLAENGLDEVKPEDVLVGKQELENELAENVSLNPEKLTELDDPKALSDDLNDLEMLAHEPANLNDVTEFSENQNDLTSIVDEMELPDDLSDLDSDSTEIIEQSKNLQSFDKLEDFQEDENLSIAEEPEDFPDDLETLAEEPEDFPEDFADNLETLAEEPDDFAQLTEELDNELEETSIEESQEQGQPEPVLNNANEFIENAKLRFGEIEGNFAKLVSWVETIESHLTAGQQAEIKAQAMAKNGDGEIIELSSESGNQGGSYPTEELSNLVYNIKTMDARMIKLEDILATQKILNDQLSSFVDIKKKTEFAEKDALISQLQQKLTEADERLLHLEQNMEKEVAKATAKVLRDEIIPILAEME